MSNRDLLSGSVDSNDLDQDLRPEGSIGSDGLVPEQRIEEEKGGSQDNPIFIREEAGEGKNSQRTD